MDRLSKVRRKYRLGIFLDHPIQYFSPLFDELSRRGDVVLSVGYSNDHGLREALDPGFGSTHKWDIDLVSGHSHSFMTAGQRGWAMKIRAIPRVIRFIRENDIIVVHGYAGLLPLTAIAAAWVFRIPYLIRSDTSVIRTHRRLDPRFWLPRMVSRRSAGGLVAGIRNESVQLKLGVPQTYFAPFSIDNRRFSAAASSVRAKCGHSKAKWGLKSDKPVIGYCGKLIDHKGIDDLVAAHRQLADSAQLFIIGDGPNRAELEKQCSPQLTVFAGFINQSEIPEALAVCDIVVLPSYAEPWGLAINEAMASGCLPVVSDAVGCGPDLVEGVGEVFPVGDRAELVGALQRALARCQDPLVKARIGERIDDFDINKTADGYELATWSVMAKRSHVSVPVR